MDPYKELGISYDPDHDILTRSPIPCTTTEEHNSLPNQSIFTQDIPINPTHKTWLRLYKPFNPPANTKLPLLVYFHGGGFIICNASNTMAHDHCTSMAQAVPCVILSVDYRLAPENRLPAAYEDAVDALIWVRNQALDLGFLKDIVDFSNCHLMGCSAGGNIAYHAGLRALSLNLQPLVIRGLVLDQPFFSGQRRTPSELSLASQKMLPLAMSDLMWELSLPKGSDRDHEYCNPLVLQESYKDKIGLLGRCYVTVGGRDILADREMEFAKMLKENGVDVVTSFVEEGCHGMNVLTAHALAFFVGFKDFIYT